VWKESVDYCVEGECRLLCGRRRGGGMRIKRIQQYVEGVRREGG
jgi:hypothetical protein